MTEFSRSGAYPWALTGIFAAVHLVITLIPFSLSVSGTGVISFGMISASIVGYLLGPFFGTVSVLIGSYLGIFINPEIAVLGLTTPIATAAGALAAGLMRVRKPIFIPIIYIAAMILYLVGPIGPQVPELLWFHVIVFILSLLFLVPQISGRLFDELDMKKAITARVLFLFALVAVTLDQIVGSAIGSYYLVFVAGIDVSTVTTWFVAVIFIYPVERILGAIIVVFILKALVESLSTAYFDLPTIPFKTASSEELTPQEVD
ncbi:MAG: hypothetical protein JSW05_12070 [Candidatus Thorarchaeota archaeon]|nr:MAG: hypothetical protein JSW05_12070 [Candidatus Thorarchaeota archaeon]